MRRTHPFAAIALYVLAAAVAGHADPAAMADMRADLAVARYGLTGRGVMIAIIDRGIDYTHPDFIKPDGTTRIKGILDMTGQNLCSGGTPPIEYTETQINAALQGGPALPTRDAVGHGVVTTGIATGNGRAFANGKYAGVAPEADLLIVKVTSEGAPAHSGQPAEAAFQGCYDQALEWVDAKATAAGKPLVALINSGVQWGPMDGTSAVSQKIDALFGNRPGRIYVAASGDEGGWPTHARTTFTSTSPGTIRFNKLDTRTAFMSAWYTGTRPATVEVAFDSGVSSGPVGINTCGGVDNITICQYAPGNAFYPWRSNGPDRAVWIRIIGNSGSGTVTFRTSSAGTGMVDLYTAQFPRAIEFSEKLVPGRLTDYSTTRSAVVVGAHVLRHQWTDLNGVPREDTSKGSAGELWAESSGGPTRDGRVPGVDFTAPGHKVFAAYGRNTYWAQFKHNMPRDGGGWYGSGGATSGSAPLGVGAVALMLQMDPTLTNVRAKEIFHATARQDAFTGPVPNNDWGYGKLDVLAVLDVLANGVPYTMVHARQALRASAGLESLTPEDVTRLNVVNTGESAGRVDAADAIAILKAALKL